MTWWRRCARRATTRIAALVIETDELVGGGFSKLAELRAAIADFKASGQAGAGARRALAVRRAAALGDRQAPPVIDDVLLRYGALRLPS